MAAKAGDSVPYQYHRTLLGSSAVRYLRPRYHLMRPWKLCPVNCSVPERRMTSRWKSDIDALLDAMENVVWGHIILDRRVLWWQLWGSWVWSVRGG
jgi:hypothetical protein